mgnify:FL=1
MKSTYLRVIAAMLALVMIVTCFASCAGNGDDTTTITKPSDVAAPVDDDLFEWDDPAEDNNLLEDDSTTSTTAPTTTTTTTTAPSTEDSGFNAGDDEPSSSENVTLGTDSSSNSNLSQADIKAALNLAGYEYDAKQDIYYSTLEPWQRHFGFGDEYDVAAAYANMRYVTFKADFEYDGLLWRLQWWKGQYGVLEGAEMGVYTKDPNDTSTTFYDCADNDHLMKMYFEYYRTTKDYNADNMLFYREEQDHWWLTGFKFGYTAGANKSVIKATIEAYDKEMADGIESGLKAVKDNKGNWNGFIEYSPVMPAGTKNFYQRKGNKFTVVWVDAGYLNYQTGAISPEE